MRFALMRNGLDLPTVAARSEAIVVKNKNEPTNGHLALTGREGCAALGCPGRPLLVCGAEL